MHFYSPDTLFNTGNNYQMNNITKILIVTPVRNSKSIIKNYVYYDKPVKII